MDTSPFRPTVVAAIDFGTHGTGFAWCVVSEDNENSRFRTIQYYTSYPGAVAAYAKNLSALLVDDGGEVVEWGHAAVRAWRERQEEGTVDGHGLVTGYKMALGRDRGGLDLPLATSGVDLTDRDRVRAMVAGCLRRVYRLALKDMAKSQFSEHDIRWCLTVPAIWDEYDKDQMRRAAVEAGLPDDPERLLLVYEPEAAGIAAHMRGTLRRLDGSGEEEEVDLRRAGTRLMVVDCGGGTVDITSYETQSDERVELGQIGRTSGEKFGSAYINHGFTNRVLGSRFGEATLRRLEREVPSLIHEMSQNWEEQKLNGVETEVGADGQVRVTGKVRVDIPGELWELLDLETRSRLRREAGRPYRVLLQPEEVKALFDEVVEPILGLVDEGLKAMRATPSTVPDVVPGQEMMLLVGGFAQCGYLWERLNERFGHDIMVVKPPESSMTVLEGATHYAYQPDIVSFRRARYTFALEVAPAFREGEDPDRLRITLDGRDYCRGRLRRLVRKGDRVETHATVSTLLGPLTSDQSDLRVALFRTLALDPVYADEPGSVQLCELVVDLSDSVGRPKAERGVDIQVHFGRAQIEVDATSRTNGMRRSVAIAFRPT